MDANIFETDEATATSRAGSLSIVVLSDTVISNYKIFFFVGTSN